MPVIILKPLVSFSEPSKVTSLEATTLDMNTIQLRWTVDTNSKQDKFSVRILKFRIVFTWTRNCNVTCYHLGITVLTASVREGIVSFAQNF